MNATPRVEPPKRRVSKREREFEATGDSVKHSRLALDKLRALGVHNNLLDIVRDAIVQDVQTATEKGESQALEKIDKLLD